MHPSSDSTPDQSPTDAAIPTPRSNAAKTVRFCIHENRNLEFVPYEVACQIEKELHLAKSPVVAGEAERALATDMILYFGVPRPHNEVAAIITRHFQPVLEENERLKKAMGEIYLALGTNEADHTRWPEQISSLNKELEEAKTRARSENANATRFFSALEAAHIELCDLRSKLATLNKELDTLRAQLAQAEGVLKTIVRGSGCLIYLDGRNEHGTHILSTPVGGVDWDELSAIEVRDGDPEFIENVFKEAESLGFKAGDSVWIDWRHDSGQMGNEGRWEILPYWEYNGVNKEVSLAISSLTPGAGERTT